MNKQKENITANFIYNNDYIERTLSKLHKKGNNGLINGVVRTILDGKIIDEYLDNVTVANGRRFVAQKIFQDKHQSDEDYRNWHISYFGLGQGGAITVGTQVNLLGPQICDKDLYNAIPLSNDNTSFLTSPGDSVKNISPVNFVAKPIDDVNFVTAQDIDCSYTTHSYIRCVCVKSIGQPDYLENDNDYIMINEACLYIANTNNISSNTSTFAHICFPPKYVAKKSEFVIEWYVLC